MKYIVTLFWILLTTSIYSQTIISNTNAFDSLRNHQHIQLLDVRTPEEFENKHLLGATNIDWKNTVTFDAAIVHLDKNKPLYIYCLSGGRSAKAAQKLTDLGFQVFDIEGGISKWESADLPMYRKTIIKEINNPDDFFKNLKENKIVLAYFYTEGSPENEKIKTFLNSLNQQNLQIITIDVNEHKKLRDEVNINSSPTLIIYTDSQKTWTHSGPVDLQTIEKQLKKQ